MTMMRRWRRITLQLSHIGLTLGRTFMVALYWFALLVPIRDPTPGEVVGGEFHLHLVAGEDADVVHAHLAGDVRQDFVPVVERDLEHGVRKRFEDLAFQHDRIFLWLRQGILLARSWCVTTGPLVRRSGGL